MSCTIDLNIQADIFASTGINVFHRDVIEDMRPVVLCIEQVGNSASDPSVAMRLKFSLQGHDFEEVRTMCID